MDAQAAIRIVTLGLAAAAAAPAMAQVTQRVSLSSGGLQGNAVSNSPALSDNSRYVAFYSEASNLVPGDTNGVADIFVRDMRTQTTVRVSIDTEGVEANGDSYGPTISASGRFVAFHSEATNLVTGDTNGVDDVFLHDLLTGATRRVSVGAGGAQANQMSVYPSLSADGRLVVFHSWASNLIPGDTNGYADVFVRDVVAGTTTRVSVSSTGSETDYDSEFGVIDAAGTRVAFATRASNVVPGDSNGSPDIFVRDLINWTTTCVSVDSNGVQGNGGCSYPSISRDGLHVGYESWSTNLVAGDTNNLTDVFVHDLVSATTSRISVSTNGTQGNSISTRPSLSRDARFVAFKSQANNLIGGDTNIVQDIFVHDRLQGTTRRVNVGPGGAQTTSSSSQPVMSADGRHVAYYSNSDILVPGDTNGVPDVFLR